MHEIVLLPRRCATALWCVLSNRARWNEKRVPLVIATDSSRHLTKMDLGGIFIGVLIAEPAALQKVILFVPFTGATSDPTTPVSAIERRGLARAGIAIRGNNA